MRDSIRRRGWPAERGGPIHTDDKRADVVHGIPGVHIESKYVERLDLWGAIQQAENDAGALQPVVVFRRNHTKWRAIVDWEWLLDLLELRRV